MKGFFKGSATALITPFCETGVNYDVLGELIEFQIENGVAYLLNDASVFDIFKVDFFSKDKF